MQEEALLAWFEAEGGVLICAPTGMGKTLIAEAAIFEALHTRQRLYYTTPLIALTEQKFREFQDRVEGWGFSRSDVGFITGNRRENPDALIRVVVAEILLNHLLAKDPAVADLEHVGAVVMDEFHNFNDPERGVVWELALALLPPQVRVMLLSATVGNPYDFADWLKNKHGRRVQVVTSDRAARAAGISLGRGQAAHRAARADGCRRRRRAAARRPWCSRSTARNAGTWPRSSRACRSSPTARSRRSTRTWHEHKAELAEGVGPKLGQMLLRGVGVHHAGVLPRHKLIVEELFGQKLVPFVCCTETLAAGINLPARSVVLSTLLKGQARREEAHRRQQCAPDVRPRGPAAVRHAGPRLRRRARGRRQDQQVAEEVRPDSGRSTKDPGMLRIKQGAGAQAADAAQDRAILERGAVQDADRRRAGQAVQPRHDPVLGADLPADADRARCTRCATSSSKRFAGAEYIEKFSKQLNFMLDNLQALGYLKRAEDGDHVTLDESIYRLLNYRSVDPLFGDFLAAQLGLRRLRGEAARAGGGARSAAGDPAARAPPGRLCRRGRCRSRCSSRC